MATARSVVFTAAGRTQETKDADTQLVSGTIQNGSGSLTINAAATSAIIQVAGSPVLTISSAAISAAQPIAMGSNKITGLAQGTGSNEALCYPWIGDASSSSVLSSTYTISADNGGNEDTGLSITLPSAGTYLVGCTVRSNINAAISGTGSYILTNLFNSTDSTTVANSEEIGAYAATTLASYYGVSTVILPIVVAASKTIKLYAKSVSTSSTTTRTINSDANGRTVLWYVKIA